MFFANDLLLAVCFFLDYGNDVRQKANSSNFLIRIQRGWQSSRATSIMHVAQELLMDIQRSGGSGSFAKKTRTSKMRSAVAGIGSWHHQLRGSSKTLHMRWPKYSWIYHPEDFTMFHHHDCIDVINKQYWLTWIESPGVYWQLHVSKNSMWTILWLFNISSKLERWKSSVSECLMSWLKFKKNCRFEQFLFYATTMNHFFITL